VPWTCSQKNWKGATIDVQGMSEGVRNHTLTIMLEQTDPRWKLKEVLIINLDLSHAKQIPWGEIPSVWLCYEFLHFTKFFIRLQNRNEVLRNLWNSARLLFIPTLWLTTILLTLRNSIKCWHSDVKAWS
jgi:hypothetical protein